MSAKLSRAIQALFREQTLMDVNDVAKALRVSPSTVLGLTEKAGAYQARTATARSSEGPKE